MIKKISRLRKFNSFTQSTDFTHVTFSFIQAMATRAQISTNAKKERIFVIKTLLVQTTLDRMHAHATSVTKETVSRVTTSMNAFWDLIVAMAMLPVPTTMGLTLAPVITVSKVMDSFATTSMNAKLEPTIVT